MTRSLRTVALLAPALLALSAAFSVHFTGRNGLLPGLVLPVLSAVVLVEFAPGRVDHHNIQIILSLLIAFATVKSWSVPGFAMLSGLASATSLAIGLETLPIIIPAVAAYGLAYVLRAETKARMRYFGLSFGLGALVHLFLALPAELWLTPACDAISIVFISAVLGVGLIFSLLPLLPGNAMIARLFWGIGLGGLLVTALVLAFRRFLDMPRVMPYAPQDALHLILTYSHQLDLALCHRLLGHGFEFAGLIGSKTKWARFRARLTALGHSPEQIARLTCPIGRPELGKHPQAIAIGVASANVTSHVTVAQRASITAGKTANVTAGGDISTAASGEAGRKGSSIKVAARSTKRCDR